MSLIFTGELHLERSRALWGLGRARVGAGRFDEAADLARQAAAAAQGADAEAKAEAWMLLAMARAFSGSLEGIVSLERGLALAERSGAPSPIGQGSQFLTDLLEMDGQIERALAVATRGIDLSDRLGLASFHGSDLRGRAALILLDLVRWDEAAAILEPADPRAFPSLARALLALRRGDDAMASAAFDAAAIGGAIGGPGSLGGWLEVAQAEAAWTRGDRAGVAGALAVQSPVPGVWALPVHGRVAWWRAKSDPGSVTLDDIGTARLVPDHRLSHALAADMEACRAEVSVPAARPSGDGRHVAVAEAWAAAVAAWDVAGRPYERAYARLCEASARFSAGHRDVGRTAVHEVSEIAEGLGARPLRAWAEDLARRARVLSKAPRRSMPDPAELTARESEVHGLLDDGLTNPAIAERLYLSPKTVGIHVSRILERLDAHTRGQAVAVARRKGLLS